MNQPSNRSSASFDLTRAIALSCVIAAPLVTGCQGPDATAEEVSEATTRVQVSESLASRTRDVFAVLGVLPVYTCDEGRDVYVGNVVSKVSQKATCATVTTNAMDAETDAVVVTFAPEGCDLSGHHFTGVLTYRLRGGQSRFEVEADLATVGVDGVPFHASVGIGTCGAQRSVWASVEGTVAGHPEYTFSVEGRLAEENAWLSLEDGRYVLDLDAQLSHPDGTDRVTLRGIEYVPGNYMPTGGTLTIETSSGDLIEGSFHAEQFLVGEARVSVNGSSSFGVPFVHF